MGKKRKILIVMMDGFDPSYLQASDMPNTKGMIAGGFYKTVKAMMPTVTNVNNTGICTGTAAKVHGITANSYFDLATKQEQYMDKASMLLAPTIFERGKSVGMRSALLTAKAKTQTLLRAGADILLAAEKPQDAEGSDIDWVARLGPPPDIYSAEINHWLFKAVQIVLNETDTDITYYHTTDYPMHMEPATGEMSQFHLSEFDGLLGQSLNDHPDLEVYMTADHGMNFKSRCHDLNKIMPEKGCDIFFAMSAERDPYIKHHRTFGGTAYVFLNDAGDFNRAADIIRRLDGVDGVYDRYAAAGTFDLRPDRIGDMVVTGDIDTVFGPLENAGTEELAEGFRTHGSTHESTVPLIIHNREVNFDEWHDYAYNYNVTKPIGF
ncbi:MAG: alkaline phosphatase family protein [Proteobacteria bacterium]|nr:alkaline phosphatase family protein [Pseudomonadota bacterium]